MYERELRERGMGRLWRGYTPFTWTVIALYIVSFFLTSGIPSLPLALWGAFRSEQWWLRPWTLVTWPLIAYEAPLSLIFGAGWMYLFGGSMERSWGTSVFARFYIAMAALSALTYGLGELIGAGPGAILHGIWPAMGATVVAWALVNRHETLSFFFLPLPAWAVGLLGVATTWFYAGGALIGLFALSGCGAAYWYVTAGRTLSAKKAARRSDNVRFLDFDREVKGVKPSKNPFTRAAEERKRRERDKKLEEMFRRSGYDDDGDRPS